MLCFHKSVRTLGDPKWGRRFDHIDDVTTFQSGWHGGDAVAHCWVCVARLSAALLDALHAQLHAGQWAYCEWQAATLCEMHLPNCPARSYGHQRVFGDPFNAYQSMDPARWNYSEHNPPQLFHKVKL